MRPDDACTHSSGVFLQVDFLPSKAMGPEELAALKARLADMAARMRTVETIIDGQPERFSIFFRMDFKTNGGRMMDVQVGHSH